MIMIQMIFKLNYLMNASLMRVFSYIIISNISSFKSAVEVDTCQILERSIYLYFIETARTDD